MQIFDFTVSSPPSDEQFETISRGLLASLCERMSMIFEVLHTHVESGSWVTINIRSCLMHERLMNLRFAGIISYSLRNAKPSIQSVLLPFSDGKRLSEGKNTILVASFVEDQAGGRWEDFKWTIDEYDEWQ